MTLLRTALVGLLALVIFAMPAMAEDKKFDNVRVEKVEGRRLSLSKDGMTHSAEAASDVSVTIDGKASSLSSLRPGMTGSVTVRKDGGTPLILKIDVSSK